MSPLRAGLAAAVAASLPAMASAIPITTTQVRGFSFEGDTVSGALNFEVEQELGTASFAQFDGSLGTLISIDLLLSTEAETTAVAQSLPLVASSGHLSIETRRRALLLGHVAASGVLFAEAACTYTPVDIFDPRTCQDVQTATLPIQGLLQLTGADLAPLIGNGSFELQFMNLTHIVNFVPGVFGAFESWRGSAQLSYTYEDGEGGPIEVPEPGELSLWLAALMSTAYAARRRRHRAR